MLVWHQVAVAFVGGVFLSHQVNQVKGLYVEDSDIYGSGPNGVALDGVAVQYGHICRSKLHHADWCTYLKGDQA